MSDIKVNLFIFVYYRLTFSIYRVVSVALFSRHQLTFSTMLATSIMRANEKYEDIADIGTISSFEWMVFLQGNVLANMMDEKQLQQHDGIFLLCFIRF